MKHLSYLSMLLVSTSLLFCSFMAYAQLSPQWDKTLGGDNLDNLTNIIPTNDGNYILAGYSSSNASGDKSENSRGLWDYWIVKVDESGNKLWDKTIGGDNLDNLTSIILTNDGSYLIAGSSTSNASGDKSEDSKGGYDFWIVKIDESGNKLWDKTIGGDDYDTPSSIKATEDGGYLLAGYSRSNTSGDKSENNRGGPDYWIVKIDADGHILWDKTLGGASEDWLTSTLASDEGFILAGYSSSNASGEKSEDSKGIWDYWIVKIDESGNKLWDKTLGGNDEDFLEDIITTSDGGYLLGGNSWSNASGDKSEDRIGGEYSNDYWIIKVDKNGNKEWDNTLGGNSFDGITSILMASDGGYFLAGSSYSNASGDKSEDSKGENDYWIVKVDKEGNKLWDKTLGGKSPDYLEDMIPVLDDGYLLAGSSLSDASGDKSVDSKGNSDYWIIKVVEEDFFIRGLSLVNAETDKHIQEIKDGDVIDLASLSSHQLSIVATTESEAEGSVHFSLRGPFIHGHTENYAPYALFGDNPRGDFSGRILPPGEYTLIATPYAEKNKAGDAGTSLEIKFTIIHSDEIEDSQVTGFDLYDALKDQKIMELTDGIIINTDELEHEALTVLMHTMPDFVGSVKVELWGPRSLTRIENTKPYALFRNNSKDLFGEVLPAGEYTLRATPYPEKDAQGEAGEPLEISFTVHAAESSSARLEIYPVPTSGVLYINDESAAAGAQMMLMDYSGNVLLTRILNSHSVEQLDLSSYKKGTYYLKVISQDAVQVKRVVVE